MLLRLTEQALGAWYNSNDMNGAPEPRLAKSHRLVYDVVTEQGHGTHLLVSEILLPGADAAYYEPPSGAHAHFRCSACGRVEDVAYEMPDDITQQLARDRGLAIDSAQITLHGRCKNCTGTV